MNISSITVSQMQISTSSTNSSGGGKGPLSSDQLSLIDETLSQYDTDNLTESDAKAIVEAFEEAGIAPGRELEYAMSEAGFSAQEVGTLAGVGQQEGQEMAGMPPPPPPQSEEEMSSIETLLEEILASESEDESTTAFNTVMDYTDRIVRLNDEAKEEVMELFSSYNSSESSTTEDQVITALSEILDNTENYNSFSIYV